MSAAGRQISSLTQRLAHLYGVETSYRDSAGRSRAVAEDTVLTLLRALGADLEAMSCGDSGSDTGVPRRVVRDLEGALEERRQTLGERLLEPVVVAWDGRPGPLMLRPPPELGRSRGGAGNGPRAGRSTLRLEDGSSVVGDFDLVDLDLAHYHIRDDAPAPGRRTYIVPPATWARGLDRRRLPLGYHRLTVEVAGEVGEARVIAAPRRCFAPQGPPSAEDDGVPGWALFAPLYALRGPRDWGAGDVAELRHLAESVHAAGGRAVATLPLLAAYLDQPFEPAPYRPVSRVFWNEFYLAPELIPGFSACTRACEIWDDPRLQEKLASLRTGRLVDYRETMALKRMVLEELAACFFAAGAERSSGAFRSYLAAHPEAEDYAAFRAEVEGRRVDWREWPEDLMAGRSALGAERPEALPTLSDETRSAAGCYHLYCQWRMDEQLAALAGSRSAAGLLLDLPVGAHPGGYDTWRWRHLFVHGVSTGAPPDEFFALGQDWDFPPLHPDRIREAGHAYFVACLRHHMRHAKVLRVDHMMGLHRIYIVPEGSPASSGAYLRYPADELYAVLALESVRSQTVVVGEDLGTVPPGVRSAMRKRGVMRTWVLQLSVQPRSERPVAAVPPGSLVSLNTHDMFPFKGFLLGRDIQARVETGQSAVEEASRQAAARRRLGVRLARFLTAAFPGTCEADLLMGEEAAAVLLPRALRYLAESAASLVLVNVEDLLLETEPQNLPGTGAERPNWRRKLRCGQAEVEAAIIRAAAWLRSSDVEEGR